MRLQGLLFGAPCITVSVRTFCAFSWTLIRGTVRLCAIQIDVDIAIDIYNV